MLHYTVLLAWEKEGELATIYLEFEFHLQFPCGSLSTKLSDFCQSASSGNKGKWKQTLKKTCKHAIRIMTSLLMSPLPITISHWLFWCRFSNFRDIVASPPSSSCPEASLGKPKPCQLLLSNICKSQVLNFCTNTIISINWLIHLSLVSLITTILLGTSTGWQDKQKLHGRDELTCHTSIQMDQYCPLSVDHVQDMSRPCWHLTKEYNPAWHLHILLDQTLSAVRTEQTLPCS